jgi:hypothetical protein
MSAGQFTDPEFSLLSAHISAAGKTRDVLLLKLSCGTGYRLVMIFGDGFADRRVLHFVLHSRSGFGRNKAVSGGERVGFLERFSLCNGIQRYPAENYA